MDATPLDATPLDPQTAMDATPLDPQTIIDATSRFPRKAKLRGPVALSHPTDTEVIA